MWFCFVWFWPRLLHFSLVFHYLFSSLLCPPHHLFSFLFSFLLVVWTVLFMAQPNTYSGRFSPNLVNFKQATKRTEATPISSNLSGKLLLASISFFFCCHGKPFHILERRFSFRTLRKIWNLCWKIVSLAVVLVVMRFYFGGWRFFMAIIMQTPCSRSTILIKTICRF